MAAYCPRCQNELPQDSGLVLCPNCGHPSILDPHGNLEESGPPPIEHETLHELPPPVVEQPEAEPAPNPLDFGHFQIEDPASEESHNDPFAHMNEPPSQEINISEYANSEFSQGKNGAYVYNVSISDIDSKEIRGFLREAISDTRFNWDAQAILLQIKNGELLLKNLSPVKASILINRIKRLPVKIRWEQYAITQAEQDSSTP